MIRKFNPGVYCIYNKITYKFYIGSSSNVDERLKWHKSALTRNVHPSKYLQASWNKRNPDQFRFKVLRYCTLENYLQLEQYFINALKPEYNTREIANSQVGVMMKEETKQKLSILAKSRDRFRSYKAVVKICPITKNILESYKSVKEAGKMNNIRPKYISAVLKHKRSKTGGFNWDYKK